jgi:hypothetical protein
LKWVIAWGALGLLVPAITALNSNLNDLELYLWPGSIMFLGLADAPTPNSKTVVVEVWSIALASNIVLYALVGTLTSPIVYLATRKRRAVS